MPIPIYYCFTQRFSAPAFKAYDWCTTYAPEDHDLMGEKEAHRSIEQLTDRTILLTDEFRIGSSERIEKKKLVQLYPETLSWTSTHISGPAKHSQFLYRIFAEGEYSSRLEFTGLFMDYSHEKMSKAETTQLAEKICQEDSAAWVLLAKALEQDIGKE